MTEHGFQGISVPGRQRKPRTPGLPVTVLPGVTCDIKHKTAAHLAQLKGTGVNFANVEHDELYLLECIRRGPGGDTSHSGGAYRLAVIGNRESRV